QPLERWHEWIAERALDPIAGDAVRHELRLQILPAAIARHIPGARRPRRDARARPRPRAGGARDERAHREYDDPGSQPTRPATMLGASRSRITAFHAAYAPLVPCCLTRWIVASESSASHMALRAQVRKPVFGLTPADQRGTVGAIASCTAPRRRP